MSQDSLRDITNTIKTLETSSRSSISPIKPNRFGWKGKHVVYNKEGNTIPVHQDAEDQSKPLQIDKENNCEASGFEEYHSDSDTESDTLDHWPFWTFRSPHKLRTQWCGTHVTLESSDSYSSDSDNDADNEDLPVLEEVMSKLNELPQLLYQQQQQQNEKS